MITTSASGTAFRLVRAAMERRLSQEQVDSKDSLGVMAVLATMAGGLLEDLGHATGESPEAILDLMQVKSMESLL